jgi:hypothetical protein
MFFVFVRAEERAGKEPLSTSLFRNRTSNLGLITQNTQLLDRGVVVAAYLQVVRGYEGDQTGVISRLRRSVFWPARWPPNAGPSGGPGEA